MQKILKDTDQHFKNRKIINFDMIKNKPSQNKIQQYQTIDHDGMKQYPLETQQEIRSSIFRNINRNDMFLKKNYQRAKKK